MENAEIEKIAEKIAEQVLKKMAETEKKTEKKRILHNTFVLMENYASLKKYADSAISETSQIGNIGFSNTKNEYLNSIRKSRVKTMLIISHIDESIKELKKDCEKNGENYKFEAFKMHYIQNMPYEKIQEKMNCGKNSPSRWCKEMIRLLSIKLFGIDGIEKW